MAAAIDPLELLTRLIACPSITPVDGGAQALLGATLESIGFEVHRFEAGEPPDGPVTNLFAIRGSGAPHFAFAGHTDVVPPGFGWTGDPFGAQIRDGFVHGRGAVDMKGAIAAFVAAAARVPDHRGTLSLIITGDEEGPAVYGTSALIDFMSARGVRPDMIVVGEPTSEIRLGDTIKIGRRGSVNMWITVPGRQAHVAYPHHGDNPISRAIRIGARLDAMELDSGDEWFEPSNLELTTFDVENSAHNVIPGEASLRLNIRFNTHQHGVELVERVRAIVEEEAPDARLEAKVSGEAFLTEPGPLSALVTAAIEEVTGRAPKLSTGGGTSDARFLNRLCPVVEFGLPGLTMHQLDEAVTIQDLQGLTEIYTSMLGRVFG